MVIEKQEKKYTVTEYKNKWTISNEGGKFSVSYGVPKEICASSEELYNYVMNNKLF